MKLTSRRLGDASAIACLTSVAATGAGLAGMFGGGSGNQGGVEALSDADAAGVIEACGEGLKNIICLSVGVSSGGGVGAALFGTGGEDSKGFPAQSDAEQVRRS